MDELKIAFYLPIHSSVNSSMALNTNARTYKVNLNTHSIESITMVVLDVRCANMNEQDNEQKV